jgi:hypothetical protein
MERLLYIIESKLDGKGMDEFSTKAEKIADRATLAKAEVRDLQRQVDTKPNAKNAEQTAAKLGIAQREAAKAEAALAALGAQSGRTNQMIGLLGPKAEQLAGSLRSTAAPAAAASAAIGLASKVIGEGISTYVAAASEVRAYQRVTLASAKDSSILAFQFKELGIDADTGTTALFRLNKTLGTTPEKITGLGIAVAKTKDGQVDTIGTLHNLADAYKGTEDPARRAAIVQAAFGRGGQEAAKYLASSNEQLREFAHEAEATNHIFSGDDTALAKQYQLATRELHASFSGLSVEVGKVATPAVLDFTRGLVKVVEVADRLASHVGGLGKVFSAAVSLAVPFAGPLMALGHESDEAAKKSAALADAQAAAADAARYEQENEAALAATLDDQATKSLAAANATLAHSRAHLTLERSGLSVQQAQQAVNDLSLQGEQRTRALRDAEERLTDSRARLGQATRATAQKQQEYDRIVKGFGASSREAAAAQRELYDATLSAQGASLDLADARQRVADALNDYNQARAQFGTGSAEEVAAQRALQRAQLEVTLATERKTDAQQAEADAGKNANDVVNGTGPASDKAKTALAALTEAQKAERDASRGVRDAAQAVTDAHRAGAGAALQRRSAELALREAYVSQTETYANYAKALTDEQKAQAAANGTTWTAAQYNGALLANLKGIVTAAPAARDALREYVALLQTLSPTAEAKRAETRARLSDRLDGVGGNSTLTVVLTLDGAVAAQAVVPHLPAAQRTSFGRGAARS